MLALIMFFLSIALYFTMGFEITVVLLLSMLVAFILGVDDE